MNQGNAALVAMANLQTPRHRDVTPPGRSEVPWHSPAPPQQHLGVLHLNLVTQPEERRPQEADDADRVGLGGGHERQAMGEEPSQTGEEYLDPGEASRRRLLDREGAASRPRRMDREGAAVKRANFAGKKEVARERTSIGERRAIPCIR